MRNFISSTLATLAVVSAVHGQDATVSTESLTVAATTVSPVATLFPGETVQLTDKVLDDVSATIQNETISDLFLFGNDSTATLEKRSLRSCKTMPGDFLWPINLVWEIFDILLGRRLIKATPLAAYCYPDRPEYNAAMCTSVSGGWLASDVQ
jgi:hypothetical protein